MPGRMILPRDPLPAPRGGCEYPGFGMPAMEDDASTMGVETAPHMCHLMCGGSHMATNLSSNPELFECALEVSGERTSKAAVTRALQESNSSVLPGST
jgi:hypothetical protein